jgi:hypothetical protein
MRAFIIVAQIAFLSACVEAPAARLQLVNIELATGHFGVIIDSNIHLGSVYADSSWRTPGSPAFVCSTEPEPEYDIEAELTNIATGTIDFIGPSKAKNGRTYRYRAHLLFWRTDKQSQKRDPLYPNELKHELRNHSSIACKVRISTYMGPPYYSEVIHIPAQLFIKVAENKS